jgi:glycosyltransferase involved in cell wall biosynthesis
VKHRLGILATHPIQYFSPWYRALAAHPEIDLQVYYACRQTVQGQAAAGFGIPFEWDQPLLEGYRYKFLTNIARHPSPEHFFGCDTPAITEAIIRERFSAFLVSGWSVRSFWQAIRACWKTGTPILVRGDSHLGTRRSWAKRAIKFPFYRWFIPRFDGYLVVGRRAKEYFLHYGASERKMTNVPHAVDNRFFAESSARFSAERGRWRRDWGIPEDAVVFLYVGKLIPVKRPMDFLQAFQKTGAGRSPRLWGLVAGDGPLRPEMERFAVEHQLPVRFSGFLNQGDISKAYAASDALVLPGSETWGLAANEAMACGLPVLVSDQTGCGPDLAVSGQTGEVYPCGDVRKLSEMMQELAVHPDRLLRMGESALKKIEDYSIERAVQGTVAALNRLWKERRQFK